MYPMGWMYRVLFTHVHHRWAWAVPLDDMNALPTRVLDEGRHFPVHCRLLQRGARVPVLRPSATLWDPSLHQGPRWCAGLCSVGLLYVSR